jgi:hypothetical protein
MDSLIDTVVSENKEEEVEFLEIAKDFMHMIEDYTQDLTNTQKRSLNAIVREEGLKAVKYIANGEETMSIKDASGKLLNVMEVIDKSIARDQANIDNRNALNAEKNEASITRAKELLEERKKSPESFEMNELSKIFFFSKSMQKIILENDGQTCDQCKGLYWGKKGKGHNLTEGHKLISKLYK